MSKENIVGGWIFEPVCLERSMPQKIATGFAQATHGFVGGKLKPYLYCGHQLTNGTNHMLICLETLTTNPPTTRMVKLVLHETPDPVIGEFSILSINDI